MRKFIVEWILQTLSNFIYLKFHILATTRKLTGKYETFQSINIQHVHKFVIQLIYFDISHHMLNCFHCGEYDLTHLIIGTRATKKQSKVLSLTSYNLEKSFTVACVWVVDLPILFSAFCLWVLWVVFMDLQKSSKHMFLIKFGSHNIIYIFKNYFIIVFSVINFQISTNKWYLNTPFDLYLVTSIFLLLSALIMPSHHASMWGMLQYWPWKLKGI